MTTYTYSLSFLEVELSYCKGTCPSAAVHSHEYPYYKSHCFCCKASEMTVMNVQLNCPNAKGNEPKNMTYVQDNVVSCKCRKCISQEK